MKKNLFLIAVLFSTAAFSQIRYSGKIEAEYNFNLSRTVTVDPGPNWQGYNLDNRQSGLGANFINGVFFNQKFFAGLGVGYNHFSRRNAAQNNVSGILVLANGEYVDLSKPRSVLFYANAGVSHIWNQYDNGSTTEFIEGGVGYNFPFLSNHLYIKTGFASMQQSVFYKLGAGFRF